MQGRIFLQCQVRARLIVIRRIRSKNSPQVRLTKDQHLVQALAAHGADQAFHMTILPWRPRQDRPVADTHGPHPGCEDMSVGAVIVAHQISRRCCPREGLGDLSGQPLGRRMSRHLYL